MARPKKATNPAASPKPPAKEKCWAIVQRFLKSDQNIVWARELPTFYKLYKQYPSEAFWTNTELPFKLNMMSWFESTEGKAHLESAYLVFNYHPSVDIAPEPSYDNTVSESTLEPVFVLPPAKPRTVAELLRTPSSKS